MPESQPKLAIKEYAAELAIDGIGFCDSAPLEQARAGIESAIQSGYVPSEIVPSESTVLRLTTPTRHLRRAKSIISAYQAYYTGESPSDDPAIGRVAMYTTSNYYEDLRLRLSRLAGFMQKEFACRTKVLCCYVTLAEKPIARKAGLGFYGKHGIIITPEHGSFVVLGEILTDLELEPDPDLDTDCGRCTRCIEACPVGAFRAPYFVDRNLCIQAHCGRRTTIPLAVREAWQNRLYGCTTCQDVCPSNLRVIPTGRKVEHGHVGSSIPLAEMLLIGDSEFEERFRNNQIGMRERNTLRRNAIVAAGNSRSDIFVDALTGCAEDPDPMVRRHALWAIWRIEGRAATALFDRALRTEPETSIREEIKTLLDGIAGLA
jgi:epoxyqueuosine reductase